ncbi:hypothetical protein QUA86_34375 [Microcoleus sp. F6_B6]
MFPYPPAEARAICKILANLPSEAYLELGLTLDQLRYWLSHKSIMLDVAEHWKALHTGETQHLSPSNDYRKQKLWLVTVMWQRLWEMTIACFPAYKSIAEFLDIEFPFTAPVQLFAHILAEEANADFEICLQPYARISSSEAEKHLRWLAKNPSFEGLKKEWDTKPGRQKLERMQKESEAFLRQTGGANFWLNFVSLSGMVLSRYSRSNAFIKSSVEAYNQLIATLAKLDAKQYHTARSTVWHNGVKKKGQKGGSYS